MSDDLPAVAIDLPPYPELAAMSLEEMGKLIPAEQERTARALHAIGEPFSVEGRLRWVALWRAWLDGLDAVFADHPHWGELGKGWHRQLDLVLDYAEDRDVPPHIEKLFDGSGDA